MSKIENTVQVISKAKKQNILNYIINETESDPNKFNKTVKYVTGLTFAKNVKSSYIEDLLHDLIKYTQITHEQLEEVLKGAYIIIKNDMKIFYKKYKKFNYMMASQEDGMSSHYSYHKMQLKFRVKVQYILSHLIKKMIILI